MPSMNSDFWYELAALANSGSHYALGWRKRFSSCVDFEIFRSRFLASISELSHWIYCDQVKTCDHNCPLEVVQDGHFYYAVCVEGTIPARKISTDDIRLERFNFNLYHHLIAEVLPINPRVEQTVHPLTWFLGTLQSGLNRHRMFLTYVSPDECASELLRLSLLDPVPVVVLTPYDIPLKQDDIQLLQNARVIRLAAADFIVIDRQCRVTVRSELPRQLRELLARTGNEENPVPRFDIPAGIGWSVVSLHFLDRQTLSCRIGNSTATLSYHDLGMVNRRTGAPDTNWLLLLALAEHKGKWKVEWSTPAKAEREQQRKRRLSTALQKYFRIAVEPIPFDREKGEYRCEFKLQPESHSTAYHPRKRSK